MNCSMNIIPKLYFCQHVTVDPAFIGKDKPVSAIKLTCESLNIYNAFYILWTFLLCSTNKG